MAKKKGPAKKEDEKPPSLWEHVKKYALRYTAIVGLAMGCAAEMDGVIKVSSWVGYFTRYYRHILLQAYDWVGNLINIHLPAFVWDMAVMSLFYIALMTYGVTRGTPVDVKLETIAEKEWFVYRRVPISVLTATTCIIFAGASLDEAIRFAIGFFPLSVILFVGIAVRMKRMRYQLERETIRFLASTWLLIGILMILSQTQIFEFLAGDPPPAPEINTPGPFDIFSEP